MTCVELQEKAAGLAALPPADPERAAADAHAGDCTACTKALREAEQVLTLLDSAPPLPAPSPATLQRVAAAIRAELAAEHAAAPVPAGVVRAAKWLAALLIAISALLVWKAAGDGGIEVGEGIECLGVELGSAALAVLAFTGISWLAVKRAPAPGGAYAALAGVGAIAGQVVLLWRCPAHGPSHLMVFHLGGVMAALLIGSQLTRVRWSARRS